jgi:uncharacterized protein with PQ loop repeat
MPNISMSKSDAALAAGDDPADNAGSLVLAVDLSGGRQDISQLALPGSPLLALRTPVRATPVGSACPEGTSSCPNSAIHEVAEEKEPHVLVVTLGWVAAIYSAFVAMPQLARVARTRTTAGIPLLAWQSSLAGSLSWGAYGLLAGFPNIWIPNILLTLCAIWMLIMIGRNLQLTSAALGLVFALPMMVSAATVLLAVFVGPLAFAAAAFVPAAFAQLMQLRSLVQAPDISAVSMPFLALGVGGQLLWFCWGMLVDDISNKLVAGCLVLLIAANLTWYGLRRFGLVMPRTVLAGDPAISDLPVELPSAWQTDESEDTLVHALLDRTQELLEQTESLILRDESHAESLLNAPAAA